MTQETSDIIDHYFERLASVHVEHKIVVICLLILFVIFLFRFLLLCRLEKSKRKRPKPRQIHQYSTYIFGHTILEYFIAFLVCYGVVVMTYARPESYIINYIVSPIVGSLVGLYVDNKILIPIESATGLGAVLLKDKSGNKDKQDNSQSAPTVNVNVSSPMPTENPPIIKAIDDSKKQLLDEDLADSEAFDTEVIKAINEIKLENAEQNIVINKNTIKLDNAVETLTILKDAEMTNKKIELKSLIYACLNQGYVTPEQHDKITLMYQSYVALGGNHEVKSLYERHFNALPIRNASTKPQGAGYVPYGQYDADEDILEEA